MVLYRCALALAFGSAVDCIAPPLNEQAHYSELFPGWQVVANEIAKPQVSNSSNNSSNDCKKGNQNWKFATANRN